jgi:hypothetical protein
MNPKETDRYVSELISKSSETLLYIASVAKKPLVIPFHPAKNDHGLKPGEILPGASTEIRPSCDGIVVAVTCNADEAQELVDWVMDWEKRRTERRQG